MKILFYCGLGFLLVFEFLKIYFIMPFPGSQQWDSIDFAYFLHRNKAVFWTIALILTGIGFKPAISVSKKWIPFGCLILIVGLIGFFNFKMAADAMFKEPESLTFETKDEFTGSDSMLVVVTGDEFVSKAYPVRYLVYHHQVRDVIGSDPVMVTYCSVCRTGRVFSPYINGKEESFRLVGMDYFNAMFEDSETGSWWQQATGEAIAGPLKGQKLEELEALQMSAYTFFRSYPNGLIMEPDPAFLSSYDSLGKYELGKSESKLTGTDPFSWNEKSWVVGIILEGKSKAYDWNALKEKRIIHDEIGGEAIVLLLSSDSQSFVAFKRRATDFFTWKNDLLTSDLGGTYSYTGKSQDLNYPDLERVPAYQEFWHSWRTFRPNSTKYP